MTSESKPRDTIFAREISGAADWIFADIRAANRSLDKAASVRSLARPEILIKKTRRRPRGHLGFSSLNAESRRVGGVIFIIYGGHSFPP